jgi:hypothetical protein
VLYAFIHIFSIQNYLLNGFYATSTLLEPWPGHCSSQGLLNFPEKKEKYLS